MAAELVIFLPETVEEPELKALMEEAEKAATDLNIQIIGGQTRVSSAVRQPIATATGYGILSEAAVTQASAGKKLAGQDIIITKWIGLEGTADLAARNRESSLRDTRRIWWKKQRRLTGIILFYRRPLPP